MNHPSNPTGQKIRVREGERTVTLDDTGMATIDHNLGVVPAFVSVASPNRRLYEAGCDSMLLLVGNGLLPGQTITVHWVVSGWFDS